MQDRHVDLYLGSKRDQYLRCNFNYEALGIKAEHTHQVDIHQHDLPPNGLSF